MKFPLAYFLTWTTFGNWLHGDVRGSFDALGNFVAPNAIVRVAAAAAMTEEAVILTDVQRSIVDARLVELCKLGRWICTRGVFGLIMFTLLSRHRSMAKYFVQD